ncbi:MAG: hypothetical protein GEU96_16755 [Propionibacteriales bacterium]|nr:hypothetical protein [Propionibacteriales bacterium]
MSQESAPRLIVALYGPTSSGKTHVSVELCLRLRDELGVEPVVISADSRQVYRHMDIGTSKTTREEMHGVRHEMIDVAEPIRKLELENFVSQARDHMDACWDSGGVPVVVGGTSVYVRSLLEGWEVDAVAESRNALKKDFPRSMASDAHEVLARLDRKAAAKLHANNYDGVINALAHVMGNDTERSKSALGARRVVLGIDRPVRDLDRRVAGTYDNQMRRGLQDEILDLNARYGLEDQFRRLSNQAPNQVLHTHGYSEWFELARETGKPLDRLTPDDLDTVRERVVERIRTHTRRQRSAFKKLQGVRMIRNAREAFTTTCDA